MKKIRPLKFGKGQISYVLWSGVKTLKLQAHIISDQLSEKDFHIWVCSIFKSSTRLTIASSTPSIVSPSFTSPLFILLCPTCRELPQNLKFSLMSWVEFQRLARKGNEFQNQNEHEEHYTDLNTIWITNWVRLPQCIWIDSMLHSPGQLNSQQPNLPVWIPAT
jgi:hypothetical protein